jgi:two-component system, OmpR family, sensor histidine kinase BaeS
VKLRTRLAVVTIAGVVPFAVAVAWFQSWNRARAVRETTAEQLIARMEIDRAACEARPQRWPGPARRRARVDRIFAYDSELRSRNPAAPPLPAALARELEGDDVATLRAPDHPGQELVAVRMPWSEGPCAIVVARRLAGPEEGFFRSTLLPALAISAAAIALLLLAAGPLVRRIRALETAVRRKDAQIPAGGGDELADLARAFDAHRTELRERLREIERRDEALRKYVANTTHDVMIPLTVLQGHLASIEANVEGKRPVSREMLSAALDECHYLGALVRNLSVAARLESGAPGLELHDVDLAELVQRVTDRHRPFARQRGVELECAVPDVAVRVRAEPTMLEQAVGNLVSNAIRYNKDGGHVAVVLVRSEPGFTLSVLDDGPGVGEADLAKLTERGYRGGRARTRHPSGLGLGLAIAKDVVERHGFTLVFERPREGGLRAVIRDR